MTDYSKCCTCGYEWRSGMSGSHRCADKLQKENKALRKELEAVKASIPKLKAEAVRELCGEEMTIGRLRNDQKRSWVFISDAMEYANTLEGQ